MRPVDHARLARFVVLGAVLLSVACHGHTTAPPAPVPVAVAPHPATVPVQPPITLDQARSLRAAGKLDEYEARLRDLDASSDKESSRRALALLGLFYLEQKRIDDAFATLSRAADSYPEVAPFLRLRLLDIEEQRGNFSNGARIASQIIATNGDTSAATIARLRLPADYAQSGEVGSTDASYKQAIAMPLNELTEENFVLLARKLEAAGRQDLATGIRMRLILEFAQGRYTEETYGKLVALTASPLDNLSLADSLALASRLASADRYDQALDLLERTAKRLPETSKSAEYRNIRLNALFRSRHYTDLLNETARINLPEPSLALLRARAAWRAGKPQDFLAGLRRIERDWPSSKEAAESKVMRAKYYVTDETNYDASLRDLQQAIDAGALGNEGENLWTLGWTCVLAGRNDDAMRTFDRYLRTFSDGDYRSNALFWSAKLLDKAGKRAERDTKLTQLIAEYPFGYYSYRARQIMNLPMTFRPGNGGSSGPSENVFPDVDAELAKVNDPRLASVRELLAIDLRRDATLEAKTLAATHADNLGVAFLLADAYVQGGEPFKANGILQRRFRNFVRHGGTNIPRRFWEILFPLHYWDAYRDEATKRGLDPYVLVSITRQESGFEPSTVSNAGAIGLMQIMPAEAQGIASRAGIGGVSRETLFNPVTNIAIGAAEYAQKLAAMNGNPTLAIAAYNAGVDTVGKWIAHTPVDDMDFFVESIPWAETRLYVKTVSRNRFEYRRIYEDSVSQPSQQSQSR
jgi:soluble lytic murein transglycosylase-like protein